MFLKGYPFKSHLMGLRRRWKIEKVGKRRARLKACALILTPLFCTNSNCHLFIEPVLQTSIGI